MIVHFLTGYAVQIVTLRNCIWIVLISNLGSHTSALNRPRPLQSKFFPIRNSSVLMLDAV
jgi:hypothetical protein